MSFAVCNSSKGVVKVNSKKELSLAVEQALNLSRTHTAIIEDYIDGIELSVDLFVCDGKAKIICYSYSEKIKDDNKFVIYRGCYPGVISQIIFSKIEQIAQKIADVFNLRNAPMLIQFIQKNEDLYVLEFSARTGGCIKYHMIELASGIDVIKSTVDIFEGKSINIQPVFSNKYIVNEFVYCSKGKFAFIDGIEDCIKEGLVENIFQLKNKNEFFEKVNSSGDRVAAITYVADSYEDYVNKHNKVVSKIKVLDENGVDIMRHDLLDVISEKQNLCSTKPHRCIDWGGGK